MTPQQFKRIVENSPVQRFLYHFTDNRNIESIRQHGLLSKDQMKIMGLIPAAPGGNQWSWDADAIKRLTGYVNLCFTTNHPMCHVAQQDGRIASPRYIPISTEILEIPGLHVALDIANKQGVEIFSFEKGSELFDIEVLYSRTNWADPTVNSRRRAVERYELLVPGAVPPNLLRLG